MAGTFRTSGMVSGMDTQGMIRQLVYLESIPIQNAKSQKGDMQSKQRKLQGLVSDLKSAKKTLEGMVKFDDFLKTKITSTNDKKVRASSTGGASPGSYTIQVENLAQYEKRKSEAFADSNTGITGSSTGGDGYIKFEINSVSTSVSFPYKAEGYDIGEIADLINASSVEANATVFFDGSSYRLILTSKSTGDNQQITYEEDLNIELDLDENANLLNQASNANFTVDGIAVTSETNTARNFIENITLDLLEASPGVNVKIDIDIDKDQIKKDIQAVISDFNTIFNLSKSESDNKSASASRRGLQGDSTLRSIVSQIKSKLGGNIYSDQDYDRKYNSLSDVGLKSDGKLGTYSLTGSKFDEALESDFRNIAYLFATNDTKDPAEDGIAQQLVDLIDGMIEKKVEEIDGETVITDGFLTARISGISDQMRDIDKYVERKEQSITKYEASLVKKFTAMETQLSNLQSMQQGFNAARFMY